MKYEPMPAIQLIVQAEPYHTGVSDRVVWLHPSTFGWLTRMLVWMLKIFGADPFVKGVKPAYREVNFYAEDLLKYLREAREGVRWLTAQDPKYLAVGRDVLDIIAGMSDVQIPYGPIGCVRYVPGGGTFRVYDLIVVSVPWMNGMVLLPELPR